MCVCCSFNLILFPYFRFWGLKGPQWELVQHRFKSAGKISALPFTFSSMRGYGSTEPHIVYADTDKGWQAANTGYNFVHIVTCFKHTAWKTSLTSNDLRSPKLRIKIVLQKYSTKSLMGSDSRDRWNGIFWIILDQHVTYSQQGASISAEVQLQQEPLDLAWNFPGASPKQRVMWQVGGGVLC